MIKALTHKPIISYITQEKLPEVPETDTMAKMYASKNSAKDLIYPDGLDEMFPLFLAENQICIITVGLTMRYMEDMLMAD